MVWWSSVEVEYSGRGAEAARPNAGLAQARSRQPRMQLTSKPWRSMRLAPGEPWKWGAQWGVA